MDETKDETKKRVGAPKKPYSKVAVCFKVSPEMRDFLAALSKQEPGKQAAFVDLALEYGRLIVNYQQGNLERMQAIERALETFPDVQPTKEVE